jgi:hypothetical protein
MGSASMAFGAVSRARLLFLGALALILTANTGEGPSKTLAYFVSTATNAGNLISTITLNFTTTPSGTSVFSLSNMVPGDYNVSTVNIANTGTNSNQNFTYNVASAASPGSALDQNAPSATATSGAAFVLLRCTSDAAGATPVACNTSTGVYVTQVYPAAGAGTQKQITGTNGLLGSGVLGPVDSGGATFAVSISGTKFTGGPMTFSAFNMGGPDSVTGYDSQTKGLAFGHTDYLASIVYLPTQMGSGMAGLSSTITFTWTVNQRAPMAR